MVCSSPKSEDNCTAGTRLIPRAARNLTNNRCVATSELRATGLCKCFRRGVVDMGEGGCVGREGDSIYVVRHFESVAFK